MELTTKEKIARYPKTELFSVMDTPMGVPHPFTVGPRHINHAANHFMGQLGRDAIESLEKERGGPSCCHPNCNLKYHQHQQALAIGCKIKDNDKLKEYLQSIVKQCEADGFAGFVLVDCTGGKDDQADHHVSP